MIWKNLELLKYHPKIITRAQAKGVPDIGNKKRRLCSVGLLSGQVDWSIGEGFVDWPGTLLHEPQCLRLVENDRVFFKGIRRLTYQHGVCRGGAIFS